MDIPANEQARPEDVATNPVVTAALRSLNLRVDVAKGLIDPDDKAAAAQMFTALAVAKENYDPEQVRTWAAGNGWNPAHARELAALGQKILEGRPVQTGNRQMWPDNIVYIWRQDAEGDW